jgi:glycosyltransferase EpsE
MCRVSVIIAVYNAESYIERAVESIQRQTYQDFEIIICDDCSTDKTVEKVKQMIKQDNRITLLQNDRNIRAAASRNRCLEIAKGEFVAIQDADDFSHVTRLDEQVTFLDNNPQYDFVSSKMFRYDEKDDVDVLKNESPDSNNFAYKLPYIESPKNKHFLFRLPYTHAPTMFRKNAVRAVNGYRVSKETVRGQDADLFMRLHASGSRGYNLNKSLYYYFEGDEAFKRKKFKYRLHTVIIRYKGFKAMGLMPLGYIYLFKPFIVGLIPTKILKLYRR